MFEDVIHGDDVISSRMIGQVRCLKGALQDVVSPRPPLGGDVRLDLHTCALEVEKAAKLVEVAAIAGPDVEDSAGTAPNEATIEPGSGPGPELHQEPGDSTVVLVVGVVIARIEGREL
jgi:hypothetical protein